MSDLGKAIGIGSAIAVAVLLVVVGAFWVSTSNGEIRLRNAITAKQVDNTSEFDNCWKKISQVVQVADKDRESLKGIFVDHAKARTTDGGGAIMKWVQESVPNVDSKTFVNLQNIIISSRDSWTQRQKELIDLKREHDNVIDTWPSSMICGSRGKIDISIVTSSKTKESFRTGEDNDVDLFGGRQLEKK